jgi:hypothetical protein
LPACEHMTGPRTNDDPRGHQQETCTQTDQTDKGGRVANSTQNGANDQHKDHWDRLEAFLETDPQDAGCDATMEILDVYAELVAAGADPAERFRGVRAHLVACGPCAEDLEGLVIALTGGSSTTPDVP